MPNKSLLESSSKRIKGGGEGWNKLGAGTLKNCWEFNSRLGEDITLFDVSFRH